VEAGTEALLHYAGLFAIRPRSADRLGAMLSDWLEMKIRVVEFAGAWLSLPLDQRTRLRKNGAFCRIGVDAVAGIRVWNPEARILLRVGPLNREEFERLLPDQPATLRLVSLVRNFVGLEVGFAINPILMGDAIPSLRLDSSANPAARLGWNTWFPKGRSGSTRADADEAVFEADVIEARAVRRRSAA
jgi:type VI secretion system protein ImpH